MLNSFYVAIDAVYNYCDDVTLLFVDSADDGPSVYSHAKRLTSEGKYEEAAQRFCYALFLDFSLDVKLAKDTTKLRTEVASSSNAFVALLDLKAQDDKFRDLDWDNLIYRITSPSSYGGMQKDDRIWAIALAHIFAGRLCAKAARVTMDPVFKSRALEVDGTIATENGMYASTHLCVCVCRRSMYEPPMRSSEIVVISQCCLTLPGPIVIAAHSNLPANISTSC